MSSFIHTENLSYTYRDSNGKDLNPAVRGVSLDIEKGEFVALLGHNGSGKSTFAKMLNLLLEPTDGVLEIDGVTYTGREVPDAEILSLRRKMGMVFQNPDNQLVATVVEEDIAFGPENLGIPLPELAERVKTALETVGMTAFAKSEPHCLSGGQKQRVAIAGVLAMKPDCIIFDESTAMLDPSGRAEVMATVKKLNEEGLTVVFITHYMDEAVQADRVFVIDDGRLKLSGTPDEVFSQREKLTSMGLEVPQWTAVAGDLCDLSVDTDKPADREACAKAIYEAWCKR